MIAQLADIAITLVCVTGLSFWGWWFFGKLLTPTPHGVEIYIRGQGEGERLEQSLRSLIWLRNMGLLCCPIVILDEGLTAQGKTIAEKLCQRWHHVTIYTK